MISRRRLRRVERRVMLKITERLVIQGCPSSGSEPDIAVGHPQPPGEACGLQSPRAQLRARTHGEIGSRGCLEPACLPDIGSGRSRPERANDVCVDWRHACIEPAR
jgi:hypothetical protein